MDTGGTSLDTGGNSMGGSGGGSPAKPHLLYRRSVAGAPGITRHTFCVQGAFDTLFGMAGNLAVGRNIEGVSPVPDGVFGPVASFSLVRLQGGIGELTVTTSRQAGLDSAAGGVVFVGVDMAAVSKPVETWGGGGDGAPDLARLAAWKEFRDNGDMESYAAYKCGESEFLYGSTLTLAKMIREKGVSSYTLHYPVLTATKTTVYASGSNVGEGLDKVFTIGRVKNFIGPGAVYASDYAETIDTLPTGLKWLMTGDRQTINADGTITRVMQWTGADDVDENLYEEY